MIRDRHEPYWPDVTGLTYLLPETGDQEHHLPPEVQRFVRNFEAGEYPELWEDPADRQARRTRFQEEHGFDPDPD